MATKKPVRRFPAPPPESNLLNLPPAELSAEHLATAARDFRGSMSWRIFRIIAEFIEGFQFIGGLRKTVTIFGSARLMKGDHWYEEARKLGRLLVKDKYTVVTGGGPGIMEAGNRGAFEAKGQSIGLNVELPHEQRINAYVKRGISFHYFFTRKLMLTYSADAYVYMPGGFGTIDEFFEIVTLIQTKKVVRYIPVILVGREFWGHFTAWIDAELNKKWHLIAPEDTKIYEIVDSAEEAMRVIKKKAKPRRELY